MLLECQSQQASYRKDLGISWHYVNLKNGSAFLYYPESQHCSKFDVSLGDLGVSSIFPPPGWESFYTLVGDRLVDGVNATMYNATVDPLSASQYSVSKDSPAIPVRWEIGPDIDAASLTRFASPFYAVDVMSYHPHVVAREEQYQIPAYCPVRPPITAAVINSAAGVAAGLGITMQH